ncbi:MAG: carbohydrate binding family 9 domain-containing protein [Chitinophagales bacterium]|nr:carbohydrate binding family 9 domain-containing protein [Chitinophagales bacterium]
MKLKYLIWYICTLLYMPHLAAQAELSVPETILEDLKKEQKEYTTQRIFSTSPVIDGFMNDPAWEEVEWGGRFIQWMPYEGQVPTQETAFKILYDDKNLYIGYRCYDSEPDKIVRRMSRRDGFEGDWVEVNIDSYNDKRSAFSFTISVSGVKGDEFISNNGNNWDPSWNPIWYAKTSIDSLGWIAEIRIPFSQIRYADAEELEWGIQFTRRDFREESRSIWQYISRNDPNWVSGFGRLKGLKGVKPQKQIEVQPYILAKTSRFEEDKENPFSSGKASSLSAGLDGKFGVTSDLTLDFTINPDFGQVEADPSALTLDGFRIFFPERRPFFIENRNLFNYQVTNSWTGGRFSQDNLFYSRRVGSAPHYYPSLDDGEYIDRPDNTSILGAAKFSGKTRKGLGLGIMEAVTAREWATIAREEERIDTIVEPLANYFVARASQDFNEGQTVVGGIITATQREQDAADFTGLHRSAYSGGIDFTHWLKNRTYILSLTTIFSSVHGSEETITNTQQEFEHLFQRPDADHVELDTTTQYLRGHGGTLRFGKLSGQFNFDMGVTWRSPGLELNDLGFMANADEINHFYWMGYRINEPFSIFRNVRFNYNHKLRWDFNGTSLYQSFGPGVNCFFKNFWSFNTGFNYENRDFSNNDLRGGPRLRRSKGFAQWIGLGSDQRKPVYFFWNMVYARGFEANAPKTVAYRDYSMTMTIQPTNAFNISIAPAYQRERRKVQYITDVEYEGSTRYLAGTVEQRTLYATVRANYNITPNLTIQYYGQPFISQGRYEDFKFITNSTASYFYDRYQVFDDQQLSYVSEDEEYIIDENKDGETDYSFGEPDFNFLQFRSNMVLRWEYIPGSELFLVWSQGNTVFGDSEAELIPSFTDYLLKDQADNVFLLKLTYRFVR